jgi:UDP-GlcNAc:undecaprenyl-phosphate GlcNAc-1-phosphate transferase
MINDLKLYCLIFLASSILTCLFIYPIRLIALKIGALDFPNRDRKFQHEPVPYLGGIAIIVSITIVMFLAGNFSNLLEVQINSSFFFIVPIILLGFVGLLDDIKGLGAFIRFIFQTLVAIIVSVTFFETQLFSTMFGSETVGLLITTIWIVGITNSINFVDNIDGGAAGIVGIVSFGILFVSAEESQLLVSGLAAAISGSTIGFLLWNKPPARIYMGDAGSLFLGALIAILSLKVDPINETKFESVSTLILFLAVPILDTSSAITSRIRRKISPFSPGLDHLSHRLMNTGLSKKQSILILWGMTLYFVFMGCLVYKTEQFVSSFLVYLNLSMLFSIYMIIANKDYLLEQNNV